MLKLGKVYLGTKVAGAFPAAAQFDTDPRIQIAWPPRKTPIETIGGGVTHQDFGRWAADMRLTLSSNSNFISQANKTYIDGLMATRGASYDYKDYTGTEATVIILDFAPVPTFIGDRGQGVLWEYQLVLQVLSLSVLNFSAYSGS